MTTALIAASAAVVAIAAAAADAVDQRFSRPVPRRGLLFFVGACGYVASTLYARARAYREFDRQSELALGDLGRHEAVRRKKRSRRVPLDDEETSEEAVRSKS